MTTYPVREQIMAALFALIAGSASYVTKERKLRLWTDVKAGEMPYIAMAEGDEEYRGGERSVRPTTTYEVEFYIYVNTQSLPNPAQAFNPYLDALDTVLNVDRYPNGRITLGGLVNHVYKDGKAIKRLGYLDGVSMAIVPVKILGP